MSRVPTTASGGASVKEKTARPLSGVPDLLYSDPKRWKVLYPAYFNAKKTVAEGRRVPHSMAVDRPSVHDIAESCQSLGLPFSVEDKQYCRDIGVRGRVRVMMRRDNGSPLLDGVTTKHELMMSVGQKFGELKNRPLRVEVEKKREEKEMKELLQFVGGGGGGVGGGSGASTPTAEANGGGGGSENKKKNKKKKK